jgi:hypothetical protein
MGGGLMKNQTFKRKDNCIDKEIQKVKNNGKHCLSDE